MVKSRSYSRARVWLRRLLSIFAFGVVLYLFWPLIGELRNVVDLFKEAQWAGLGFAICIEFTSYICVTMLNYLLLSPFSGKIGFWRLMAILPAMAFIEVALPSAGLSGVVLRARLLGRNGYSVEASSFTLLMETIYLSGVMMVVSIAGVWYLVESGGIRLSQLAILSFIMVLLISSGFLFYRIGQDKQRGVLWVERIVTRWNRMMRALGRPSISMEGLTDRVNGFYDGLSQVKHVPPMILLGLATGRIALDVATLGACFIAFGYAIPLGILITGYGLVLAFSGLAALPGGLGLVDASLAVIFARLGAPGAVAVAAALSYRLIAFWLVRFIGFVSWQVLEARG
ncbi:MAG TPA: flippase-like domain-containing protein [Anaerolineales bacterium]